jgi:4-amino-4-deoxychorismate lyase
MCQLLETIKCLDGELMHLGYHQSRMNLARKAFFRTSGPISLKESIRVPQECSSGVHRCRVIYSGNIDKTEFLPWQFRPINSLRLVEDNKVDYRYKFTNRNHLEQLFDMRGNCDDVLIVKNGFITDSFTANAVFFDGKKWWTPDTPLLPGTQRARLIYEKQIYVCSITPADLHKYRKAGLINAMQDLENMPVIDVKNITGY